MIKYSKIVLLAVILIFSMTACKAEKNAATDTAEAAGADTTLAGSYVAGEWITDYQQALRMSAETGNPILVNFTGSDWCIWCKMLSKEVFNEKAFIDYAKSSLVLLKLDFPKTVQQTAELKKQNEDLAAKFGIKGFPTILLMDKDGNELARTGYREGGAGQYVNHLKMLLAKK